MQTVHSVQEQQSSKKHAPIGRTQGSVVRLKPANSLYRRILLYTKSAFTSDKLITFFFSKIIGRIHNWVKCKRIKIGGLAPVRHNCHSIYCVPALKSFVHGWLLRSNTWTAPDFYAPLWLHVFEHVCRVNLLRNLRNKMNTYRVRLKKTFWLVHTSNLSCRHTLGVSGMCP